jgi:hypothetical protein
MKQLKNESESLQSCVSGSVLRLCKYTSELYVSCANLLLENGFEQTGDYVFKRKNKNTYGERIFCLYQFFKLELTLNIYYPQEPMRAIKNIEELKVQLKRFENE